jgi:ABC-type transporter Mla MlaB component
MRSHLMVSTYEFNDAVVLRLAGPLTGDTLDALRETLYRLEPVLDRLLRERAAVLVLDLSQVAGCDLSGVAILSAVGDAAVQAGVEPRLAGASGRVRVVLRKSQLGARIAQFQTVDGAVRNDPGDLIN